MSQGGSDAGPHGPERGGDTYEQVVDSIYDLQKFKGRITLDPMEDLMAELDDPSTDVPTIHIAGTNGKGSTTRILAAILEQAGYTVGTYTSPHFTDFRERIRVNGEKISRDVVVDHYYRIMDAGVDVSFFEFTTALAFLHFAAEDVDVAVIETGLGGRLDATNVVDPELSVITNIGRDHTQWLGETAEQIAYEKAGIIKEKTPVVSGAAADPQTVIEQVAVSRDAPLHQVDDVVADTRVDSDRLAVRYGEETVTTGLCGTYQCDNINAALTACDLLDQFDVPDDAVRAGLAAIELPGRMEKIADRPLVLLEGAHNPSGVRRSAPSIKKMQRGKTITVVSVMGDKAHGEMLPVIEEFSDVLLLSKANMDRAADPAELAEHVEETDYEKVPSIRNAIATALEMAADDDTIVFTGSLYFIGHVKQTLNDMWYDPAANT